MFKVNFGLGFEYVFSLQGLAHILFLMTVWVVFSTKEWRKLLFMLTAFTLGHTIAYLLLSRQVGENSQFWIDIFIPITIFLASAQNLVRLSDKSQNRLSIYPLAFSFALINGLGFAIHYGSLFSNVSEMKMPLFAFNIGLETGQICLLLGLIALGYIIPKKTKLSHQNLIITVSIFTAITSGYMILQQI